MKACFLIVMIYAVPSLFTKYVLRHAPRPDDSVGYHIHDTVARFTGNDVVKLQMMDKISEAIIRFSNGYKEKFNIDLKSDIRIDFEIDADSSIANVRIGDTEIPQNDMKSICDEIDIILRSYTWTPAIKKGRRVKSLFSIPITICNNEDE